LRGIYSGRKLFYLAINYLEGIVALLVPSFFMNFDFGQCDTPIFGFNLEFT